MAVRIWGPLDRMKTICSNSALVCCHRFTIHTVRQPWNSKVLMVEKPLYLRDKRKSETHSGHLNTSSDCDSKEGQNSSQIG
jgi:hypothetical protein